MWLMIRLIERPGPGVQHNVVGQVVKIYKPHLVTGKRIHANGVDSLGWGNGSAKNLSRMVTFHARVIGIGPKVARALMRGDRRRGYARRFHIDLQGLLRSLPNGPKKRWLRKQIDPTYMPTDAEIMEYNLAWSNVLPHVLDRRGNVVDEARLEQWDPDTGPTPRLPPDWQPGDPTPDDPTDVP